MTVDRDPDDGIHAGVADVAAFLERHGVKARAEVIAAKDESGTLAEFVTSSRADLIVSGAYGHSRLREWAFGGVTRSLLDEARFSRFMSS
ncbi:universal stress protein [Mesorhizobium sp. CN2-181]|uniref:universal stress protein n=1 Tax=Mesorhizobium yinganensis TaxID=3157707 RepID=UPI0032B7DC3E